MYVQYIYICIHTHTHTHTYVYKPVSRASSAEISHSINELLELQTRQAGYKGTRTLSLLAFPVQLVEHRLVEERVMTHLLVFLLHGRRHGSARPARPYLSIYLSIHLSMYI